MRLYAIIFLIASTTSFAIGQTNYEKISKAQNNKARCVAKEWIKSYGDSLGIPPKVELQKLNFSPDEPTLGQLDSIGHFPSKRDELLRKEIDKAGLYQIKTEYINLKNSNPQSIYFLFNRNSVLTGIEMFEFNKMIHSTYDLAK